MGRRRTPTLRAQLVGKKLRDLREQAKLSLREAGASIGKDQSTLSRVEAGVVPPQEDDLPKLMNLYGVSSEGERDSLIRLARDVWRPGWYDAYGDAVAEPTIDQSWLEARATTIRTFASVVVPGLLQVRDYTLAVHRAFAPTVPVAEIERWTEMRMMRKVVLTREEPVNLDVVIDEDVLHRPVGGAGAMARQLAHLREVAERPNVEIRVLPLAVGAHPGMAGGFDILDLPEPYGAVGSMDTPNNAQLYVESSQVDLLRSLHDRLRGQALGTGQTATLLMEVEKDFR